MNCQTFRTKQIRDAGTLIEKSVTLNNRSIW
jgi:hypothetical protein